MKTLLIVLTALAVCASVALAVGPTLPRDGEGQKVQSPAWDATLSQAVTSAASQNIDLAGKIWYEFVAATDCKGRLMNTTTKASWPQFTLKANAPFRGSNPGDSATYRAKFLNLSGCTGDFRAQ